ncbi:flagellar protein FliT [Halomonas sp. DQ26W]|uniref:flagellar protein FliT n=1 Tax=Halomonas sp. DQ26W TaxID=2282311 RepID=UPI000DF8510F|nr:flagellar protein FliT [Halomonas sp. DQ26W]RDB42729.1 flagellar protein FliT [Halomonas sp. DQ26W]
MMKTNAGGPEAVIAGYAQLQKQVAVMLELARSGEWETLIKRQTDYLQLAERLRRLDAEAPLSDSDAERKAELLESILADDMAIREQLMMRRDELGQLMGSTRRKRELHRSYGRQASSVASASDDFGQGIS